MATSLDPKQVVSFEELLMSQGVQQEALPRLPGDKKILTKEEFSEILKVIDGEVKRRKRGN